MWLADVARQLVATSLIYSMQLSAHLAKVSASGSKLPFTTDAAANNAVVIDFRKLVDYSIYIYATALQFVSKKKRK